MKGLSATPNSYTEGEPLQIFEFSFKQLEIERVVVGIRVKLLLLIKFLYYFNN